VLHRGGFRPDADFVQNGSTLLLFGLYPDLDEFVGLDGPLDFREDRSREALVADKDHGIEGMGARFERASFFSGEFSHGDTVRQSMARSKSSKAWIKRHVSDPFVQKARAQGLRSRAAFKLEQIDAKERLFRQGGRVIDLGAAPGGWSQYAAGKVGPKGVVIAVDLLQTAPMSGVTVLQGDFREKGVRAAVHAALGDQKADIVLSDMLPNVTGIPSVDQANAAELTGLAIEFCGEELKPDGVFVVKVFQGEAFAEVLARMKETFGKVATRKPEASRGESREIYLVGRGLRLPLAAQD
jgi:23S rRNA (uridine2552-2'-O)-methyltransferase